MKPFAIFLAILLLSACSTVKPVAVVPQTVQMPVLPAPLNQKADPLPPITGNDLHSLIRDGLSTDRAYNDLRARQAAVVDAWECVRVALKDGTDATKCFGTN
jgi:hypothetical protein